MAQSFIGKPISLISHSDVRYRGILAGIDPQASTIQLSNVYSMGTESRRPPQQYIAPNPDPYNYIIFRASEVKDLSVDDQVHQPQRSVHDDPAIIRASADPPKPPQPPYPPAATTPASQPQTYAQQAQPRAPEPAAQPQQQQAPQGQVQGQSAPSSRRPNPVHTAAASLETVSRAMGDLRINGGHGTAPSQHTGRGGGGRRGGRSGGGRGGAPSDEALKVPTTDFDFESSNAKFEKPGKDTSGEDGHGATSGAEGEKTPDPAYNPQKSFFDSLSSSSNAPASGAGGSGGNGGRGRRGGGGGGMGRNRREEEREKNVATFGEPGGVGLLGPGGYVGGWGGYGRRGGRRGRGGGQGRGGANGHTAVQARG